MGSRPYLQQIKVLNYRAIRRLSLDKLKMINLFGGLNTSGKTTLLESVFTYMDRLSPNVFIRPLSFRQLPSTISAARNIIFHRDADHCEISGKSRDGKNVKVSFKWEEQPVLETEPTPIDTRAGAAAVSDTNVTSSGQFGVTLNISDAGIDLARRHMVDTAAGLAIRDDIAGTLQAARSAILSRLTIHYPTDLASRYSNAIQAGKKRELISILQHVAPDLQALELLRIGDDTILHAEKSDGKLIPLSFVGDGALTLLSISLAIMQCEDGVLVIDEFDAAIHYSKMDTIWSVMARLSNTYRCQIFIATHSLECIKSAVRIMAELDHNDFQYTRLDRVDEDVIATRYSFDDLSVALRDDWEVR